MNYRDRNINQEMYFGKTQKKTKASSFRAIRISFPTGVHDPTNHQRKRRANKIQSQVFKTVTCETPNVGLHLHVTSLKYVVLVILLSDNHVSLSKYRNIYSVPNAISNRNT